MKISMNHLIKNYADRQPYTKSTASHAAASSSHNFDAITIQSNPRDVEERTFREAVSKTLSSEISKTASDEKLQSLKEQVRSNSYQIDTYAIASKILLLREDA